MGNRDFLTNKELEQIGEELLYGDFYSLTKVSNMDAKILDNLYCLLNEKEKLIDIVTERNFKFYNRSMDNDPDIVYYTPHMSYPRLRDTLMCIKNRRLTSQ